MPKVSWGRLILPGLGGPKLNPQGVGDGQPVNIPAPLLDAKRWGDVAGLSQQADGWRRDSAACPSTKAGEV